MTKRQLSEEEKKVSMTSLQQLENKKKYLNFQREYHELMINKGLLMNYQVKLDEYKKILSDIKLEQEKNDKQISILNDQLENGVEIKRRK